MFLGEVGESEIGFYADDGTRWRACSIDFFTNSSVEMSSRHWQSSATLQQAFPFALEGEEDGDEKARRKEKDFHQPVGVWCCKAFKFVNENRLTWNAFYYDFYFVLSIDRFKDGPCQEAVTNFFQWGLRTRRQRVGNQCGIFVASVVTLRQEEPWSATKLVTTRDSALFLFISNAENFKR